MISWRRSNLGCSNRYKMATDINETELSRFVQLVGALQYIAGQTGRTVCFSYAGTILSKRHSTSRSLKYKTRVLQDQLATPDHGIRYSVESVAVPKHTGYAYADCAICKNNRHAVSDIA